MSVCISAPDDPSLSLSLTLTLELTGGRRSTNCIVSSQYCKTVNSGDQSRLAEREPPNQVTLQTQTYFHRNENIHILLTFCSATSQATKTKCRLKTFRDVCTLINSSANDRQLPIEKGRKFFQFLSLSKNAIQSIK